MRFSDAMRSLGNCYAAGHGVEQDWNKAVELYRQAAKADDPESQYLLARCYAEGHGVEQDMAEAVRLYKRQRQISTRTRDISDIRGLCVVWAIAMPTA